MPDVGFTIKRERRAEPLAVEPLLSLQQHPAELVLEVQVGQRRQDEDGDVIRLTFSLAHNLQHDVDVAPHRAAHRQDVDVTADSCRPGGLAESASAPPDHSPTTPGNATSMTSMPISAKRRASSTLC